MDEQREQRESVWSVARKWAPWFMTLACLLTVGWAGFVFWIEAREYDHESLARLVIAAVNKSAPASPLIFLFSIVLVSVTDSIEGVIVVTKRYLDNKLVEPIRRQLRKEGEALANQRWKAWNERRLEAEKQGYPFTEPPPDTES